MNNDSLEKSFVSHNENSAASLHSPKGLLRCTGLHKSIYTNPKGAIPTCEWPSKISFLFFISFFSFVLQTQAAQPRIELSQREHHFGSIHQGDKATCQFPISNRGDAPLIIHRIETSCGCTGAIPGKNELAPGESSQIDVTFNSSGKQGPFQKSIYVHNNDPQNPKAELLIDGDVKTAVDIDTSRLNIGNVLLNQSASGVVRVRLNEGSQPVEIVRIDHGPRVQIQIPQSGLVPGEWKNLNVTFLGQLPTGSFYEMVTLHFSDARISPVIFQVLGQVEGLIHVAPRQVNFVVHGNPGVVSEWQSVQVEGPESRKFNLINVEIDPALFETKTFVREMGVHYEIMIQVKPGVKEKFLKAILRISTTEESMRIIEVPIQVWLPDISNV